MLTVCIETSAEVTSVALGDESGVLTDALVAEPRRHVESVLPLVVELLARVGKERGDIGAVAVDIGPGLFTGLRVGVATAKGLAMGLDIPVAPVSALELLAFASARTDEGVRAGRTAVSLDARRGDRYGAVYDVAADAGLTEVDVPFVAPAAVFHERSSRKDIDWVVALDAHDELPGAASMAELLAVESGLGRLTARLRAGDDIELLYLRASDAEIAATERSARG